MAFYTANFSEETEQGLDALATAYETSRDQLIVEAIERFVREELEFVASIKQADADIEAGRVHTQEDVEAMFDAKWVARDAA